MTRCASRSLRAALSRTISNCSTDKPAAAASRRVDAASALASSASETPIAAARAAVSSRCARSSSACCAATETPRASARARSSRARAAASVSRTLSRVSPRSPAAPASASQWFPSHDSHGASRCECPWPRAAGSGAEAFFCASAPWSPSHDSRGAAPCECPCARSCLRRRSAASAALTCILTILCTAGTARPARPPSLCSQAYEPRGDHRASPSTTAVLCASQSTRSWCPRQNSRQLFATPRSKGFTYPFGGFSSVSISRVSASRVSFDEVFSARAKALAPSSGSCRYS